MSMNESQVQSSVKDHEDVLAQLEEESNFDEVVHESCKRKYKNLLEDLEKRNSMIDELTNALKDSQKWNEAYSAENTHAEYLFKNVGDLEEDLRRLIAENEQLKKDKENIESSLFQCRNDKESLKDSFQYSLNDLRFAHKIEVDQLKESYKCELNDLLSKINELGLNFLNFSDTDPVTNDNIVLDIKQKCEFISKSLVFEKDYLKNLEEENASLKIKNDEFEKVYAEKEIQLCRTLSLLKENERKTEILVNELTDSRKKIENEKEEMKINFDEAVKQHEAVLNTAKETGKMEVEKFLQDYDNKLQEELKRLRGILQMEKEEEVQKVKNDMILENEKLIKEVEIYQEEIFSIRKSFENEKKAKTEMNNLLQEAEKSNVILNDHLIDLEKSSKGELDSYNKVCKELYVEIEKLKGNILQYGDLEKENYALKTRITNLELELENQKLNLKGDNGSSDSALIKRSDNSSQTDHSHQSGVTAIHTIEEDYVVEEIYMTPTKRKALGDIEIDSNQIEKQQFLKRDDRQFPIEGYHRDTSSNLFSANLLQLLSVCLTNRHACKSSANNKEGSTSNPFNSFHQIKKQLEKVDDNERALILSEWRKLIEETTSNILSYFKNGGNVICDRDGNSVKHLKCVAEETQDQLVNEFQDITAAMLNEAQQDKMQLLNNQRLMTVNILESFQKKLTEACENSLGKLRNLSSSTEIEAEFHTLCLLIENTISEEAQWVEKSYTDLLQQYAYEQSRSSDSHYFTMREFRNRFFTFLDTVKENQELSKYYSMFNEEGGDEESNLHRQIRLLQMKESSPSRDALCSIMPLLTQLTLHLIQYHNASESYIHNKKQPEERTSNPSVSSGIASVEDGVKPNTALSEWQDIDHSAYNSLSYLVDTNLIEEESGHSLNTTAISDGICDDLERSERVKEILSSTCPNLITALKGNIDKVDPSAFEKEIQEYIISLQASTGLMRVLLFKDEGKECKAAMSRSCQDTPEVASSPQEDHSSPGLDYTMIKPSNAMQNHVDSLLERIERQHNQIDSLQLSIHRVQGLLDGVKDEKEALENENIELESSMVRIAQELEDTRKKLSSCQEIIKQYEGMQRKEKKEDNRKLIKERARAILAAKDKGNLLQTEMEESLIGKAIACDDCEELRTKSQDLNQQLEVADRQLRKSREFIDELVTERDVEMEELIKTKEILSSQTKERMSLISQNEKLQKDVENLEKDLREKLQVIEDEKLKREDLQTELTHSREKCKDQQDILLNLEAQLKSKHLNEELLKAKIEELESQFQNDEMETVFSKSENEELKMVGPAPDCEIYSDCNRSEIPSVFIHPESSLYDEMKDEGDSDKMDKSFPECSLLMFQDIVNKVEKSTENLESLQCLRSSPFYGAEELCEDLSVGDQLEKTSLTDSSCPLSISKLEQLLENKVIVLERATEAAVKHNSDLEMRIRNLKNENEELEEERHHLQEEITKLNFVIHEKDEIMKTFETRLQEYFDDAQSVEEVFENLKKMKFEYNSTVKEIESLKISVKEKEMLMKTLDMCKKNEALMKERADDALSQKDQLLKLNSDQLKKISSLEGRLEEYRISTSSDVEIKARITSLQEELTRKERQLGKKCRELEELHYMLKETQSNLILREEEITSLRQNQIRKDFSNPEDNVKMKTLQEENSSLQLYNNKLKEELETLRNIAPSPMMPEVNFTSSNLEEKNAEISKLSKEINNYRELILSALASIERKDSIEKIKNLLLGGKDESWVEHIDESSVQEIQRAVPGHLEELAAKLLCVPSLEELIHSEVESIRTSPLMSLTFESPKYSKEGNEDERTDRIIKKLPRNVEENECHDVLTEQQKMIECLNQKLTYASTESKALKNKLKESANRENDMMEKEKNSVKDIDSLKKKIDFEKQLTAKLKMDNNHKETIIIKLTKQCKTLQNENETILNREKEQQLKLKEALKNIEESNSSQEMDDSNVSCFSEETEELLNPKTKKILKKLHQQGVKLLNVSEFLYLKNHPSELNEEVQAFLNNSGFYELINSPAADSKNNEEQEKQNALIQQQVKELQHFLQLEKNHCQHLKDENNNLSMINSNLHCHIKSLEQLEVQRNSENERERNDLREGLKLEKDNFEKISKALEQERNLASTTKKHYEKHLHSLRRELQLERELCLKLKTELFDSRRFAELYHSQKREASADKIDYEEKLRRCERRSQKALDKLKEEMKTSENCLIGELHKERTHVDELRLANQNLKSEKEALIQEKGEKSSLIRQLEAQLSELRTNNETYDAKNANIATLHKMNEKLLIENNDLKSALNNLNVKNFVDALHKENSDFCSSVFKLTNDKIELMERMSQLESTNQNLRQQLSNVQKEKHKERRWEGDTFSTERKVLMQEIRQKESQCVLVKNEMERLKQDYKLLKSSAAAQNAPSKDLKSLEDTCRYWVWKCKRMESYKRTLHWQKTYLLTLINRDQLYRLKTISYLDTATGSNNLRGIRFNSRESNPLSRFRSVCFAVIFIKRIKLVQKRWNLNRWMNPNFCLSTSLLEAAPNERGSSFDSFDDTNSARSGVIPSSNEAPLSHSSFTGRTPPTKETKDTFQLLTRTVNNDRRRNIFDPKEGERHLNEYIARLDSIHATFGISTQKRP